MEVRLNHLRILLVDGNADDRDVVFRLLTEMGSHVTQASSADAALNMIAAEPFDVLVCDIAMPVHDGYWLINQLRSSPLHAGGALPAIALSASAHDSDRLRALDAGYDAHLPKPIEPDQLVNLVKTLGTRNPGMATANQTTPDESSAPSTIGEFNGRPLHVLVVDDTKMIGEVLEQIFAALGHRATVALGGQAALDLIAHPSSPAYDVIFSDISMPGMNGHELAGHLHGMRRRGELKTKLLVAMSGYSEPEEREKSLKSGFDRHVVKPPEMEELEILLAEVQKGSS